MNRRTFIAVSVCMPLMVCTLVPLVVFGALDGQWGTNLFWGLIFGFGWWVAQSIGGPEHWRAAAAVGQLIWIPLVLAALLLVSRYLWRSGSVGTRKLFLMFLLISFLPIVPADTVMSLYANARVPPDLNLLMASW